eukprot:RCo042928
MERSNLHGLLSCLLLREKVLVLPWGALHCRGLGKGLVEAGYELKGTFRLPVVNTPALVVSVLISPLVAAGLLPKLSTGGGIPLAPASALLSDCSRFTQWPSSLGTAVHLQE